MKKIAWMREEAILTLEKYFQLDIGKVSAKSNELTELSRLLTQVLTVMTGDDSLCRSASSVLMKLMNFRALDPSYDGIGLQKTTKQDKEVWNEFAYDKTRLKRVARAIRSALDVPAINLGMQQSILLDDESFTEGKILTCLHNVRERNPKAVMAKKKKVLQQTGKLICEVCDFDFYEAYGDLGEGFIECHHIVPLAKITECTDTKVSDLALVCANCHRMLHRLAKVFSVNELKKIMNARGG